MSEGSELIARLSALEDRVASLEAALTRAAGPAREAAPEGAFWALDRLTDQAPAGALIFAGHVTLPTGERYGWQEQEATTNLLHADWQGAAPILGALGHPLRLTILLAVLHGQQTTTQLQAHPELSGAGKRYHHLRELLAAGWLTLEGRGRYVVPAQRVTPLLTILRACGGITFPEPSPA